MFEQDVINLVKNNTAYVATVDGVIPRIRPMTPYVDDDGGIWFASNKSAKKVHEIKANPRVTIFVPGENHEVSLYGRLSEHPEDKAVIAAMLAAKPELSYYISGTDGAEFDLLKFSVYSIVYVTDCNSKDMKTYTSGINIAVEQDPDNADNLVLRENGFNLSFSSWA